MPSAASADPVAYVVHLLAEFLENAVSHSPPASHVQARASWAYNGYAIEIESASRNRPSAS